MSSSQPRTIHQDYIARIRYSNALPPPPNPPKLLDIPNTGLASGQYTTPGFASRLARDQPLNIEADAELGMPIDLVGMKGIFDGDESSIQAPLHPPVPHLHDRPLLRPLSSLGKPKFSDSGVSFLRRTEYISSYTSKSRFDSTTSKSLIDNTGNRTRKATHDLDKESPEVIKRDVEKSFQTAANNLKNKHLVRHPTNRNLKVVDAYPFLPDHDAFPDAGGYVTIKFLNNPVPPSTTYDTRLENSLLQPMGSSEAEEAMRQAMKEAYERDPERNPPPDNTIEYEFFMTTDTEDAHTFKRKFDALNPDRDDENSYNRKQADGAGCIRFKRVRAYESAAQAGSVPDKYEEEVALALHDGTDGLHQKGAYYYPIVQRTTIRPQRTKNIQKRFARLHKSEDDVKMSTDYIDMRIEDPTEQMKSERAQFADQPYGPDEDLIEEEIEPAKSSQETGFGDRDADGEDDHSE